MMIRIVFVVLMWASSVAMAACESDRDCELGSHCSARPGQGGGVCTGGMLPALPHDRDSDPTQSARPAANKCTADADCGYGGHCRISTGQVFGTCVGGITGGIHVQ